MQFSRNNFPLRLSCSRAKLSLTFDAALKMDVESSPTSWPFCKLLHRKAVKCESKNRCEKSCQRGFWQLPMEKGQKKNILNKFSSSIKLNVGWDKNVYLFWDGNLWHHLTCSDTFDKTSLEHISMQTQKRIKIFWRLQWFPSRFDFGCFCSVCSWKSEKKSPWKIW